MARNRVRFQKGLSEADFEARYGTDEKCRAVRRSALVGDGRVRARKAQVSQAFPRSPVRRAIPRYVLNRVAHARPESA